MPTWIMCDFNLRELYIQVGNVPIQCWQVHYKENVVPEEKSTLILSRNLTYETETSKAVYKRQTYIRGGEKGKGIERS